MVIEKFEPDFDSRFGGGAVKAILRFAKMHGIVGLRTWMGVSPVSEFDASDVQLYSEIRCPPRVQVSVRVCAEGEIIVETAVVGYVGRQTIVNA